MDAPDVLREIYRRYARGELASIAELCHPDFAFAVLPGKEGGPSSGRYQGIDAMITRLGELMGVFNYDRFEPVEVFGTRDKAAARIAVTMKMPNSDTTVEVEIAHIVTVREGKVVELHVYFDSDRFARAMA